MAAVAHYSVHKHHILTYLRRLLERRVDSDIFQFTCAFNIAAIAHLNIFYDVRILYHTIGSNGSIVAAARVELVLCQV